MIFLGCDIMKLHRYGPDDFTLEHMSLEEISMFIGAVRSISKVSDLPEYKRFNEVLAVVVSEAIGR